MEHKASQKLFLGASLGEYFGDHAAYFDILPKALDFVLWKRCVCFQPKGSLGRIAARFRYPQSVYQVLLC